LDSQIELFWVYNFDFADTFPFLATTLFAQKGNTLVLPLLGCRLAVFLGLTLKLSCFVDVDVA
jgi:hypothetical protein